jgi:hypothetical protein
MDDGDLVSRCGNNPDKSQKDETVNFWSVQQGVRVLGPGVLGQKLILYSGPKVN